MENELYQFILLLCLLAAVGYPKHARYLGFNLFIVFCVMMEWGVLRYASLIENVNTPLSNLFVKTIISYFLYIFISQNPNYSRKSVIIIVSLYITLSLANFFFIQGMFSLNTYCLNAGLLALVFFIFRYFYYLLFTSSTLKLTRAPLFWLGTSVILFYCSLFPLLTFFNILLLRDALFLGKLYDLVPIGNIFLHLGYLMFILCPVVIRS